MRSSIVKSLIVQINMTLVQDNECILAASTAHWSLPSDPAHIIWVILLEGSSGDFLWTCPHSLPPPPASTYNTMRALKKRQDAFLGNLMHEASEQTARGSIEKQVWRGMFPRTAWKVKRNLGQRRRAMLTAIGDTWALLLLKHTMKIMLYQNLWITKHLLN